MTTATAPATPAANPTPATPAATPVVDPAATPAVQPATSPTTPASPAETVLTPAAPAVPAPAPVTEEEIKVTFPNGIEIDAGYMGKFTGLAKELKLGSAGAQKVADLYVAMQTEAVSRHVQQITTWAEEAKNDPEIGGAKWDATLASARKVVDRIGTPGLKKLLTESGLGNHREVIGLFAKIGSLIAEDKLPGGGAGTAVAPGNDQEAARRAFFNNSPGMFQK